MMVPSRPGAAPMAVVRPVIGVALALAVVLPFATSARASSGRTASEARVAQSSSTEPELPGIGATKKNWKRARKPDRNPKLQSGCCFVPKVTMEGRTQDTWVGVYYGDPPDRRVLSYYRNFNDGTDEAAALTALARDDLPVDASVVWQKVDGSCRLVQYSSDAFARAMESPTAGPLIGLISGPDGDYTPTRVTSVVVSLGTVDDQDVRC